MASWWRKLARGLDVPGAKGSWRRRYAEGRNVEPTTGPWGKEVVLDSPPAATDDSGPWDRRMGGTGLKGGWARRLYETLAGFLGVTGGDGNVASGADETVVIPIEPPQDPDSGIETPVYVTALRIRISQDHSGGNRKVKPVVYKNDNTKVISGAELTITAAMAGTSQDLTLTVPAYLATGTWYIGIQADGAVTFLADLSGVSLVAADTYSDGVADTLGSTSNRTGKAAVAAVYQTSQATTSALDISGSPDTAPTVNDAYSFTPTVAGGYAPYAFGATGQPSGTSVNSRTGKISGTLTTAETVNTVLTVTDARGNTDQMSFTVTVASDGPAPQPYVLLTNSANQSLLGNLAFDTETHDDGGWHSSGANTKAIVPSDVTLIRQCFGIAGSSNPVTVAPVQTNKNGSNGPTGHARVQYDGAGYRCAHSAFLAVSVGDEFVVNASGNGGDAQNFNVNAASPRTTWMGVEKIDSATLYTLAVRSGDQTIAGSTWTNIQFNNNPDPVDLLNCHDPTTNNDRFTPGVAGYYRATAMLISNQDADKWVLGEIRKNDSNEYALAAGKAGQQSVPLVTPPLLFNTTDYFSARSFITHFSNKLVQGASWMCVEQMPTGAKFVHVGLASTFTPSTTAYEDVTTLTTAITNEGGFTHAGSGRWEPPFGTTEVRISLNASFTTNTTAAQGIRAQRYISGSASPLAGLPGGEDASDWSQCASALGMWIPHTAGATYGLQMLRGAAGDTMTAQDYNWMVLEAR